MNSTVIFLLVILSSFFDYAHLYYFWQLKEYRLDKFLDFASTKQSIEYWKRFSSISFVLLFFALTLGFVQLSGIGGYLAVALLAGHVALSGIRILQRKLRRPKFTTKMTAMFLLSILLELFVFFIYKDISFDLWVLITIRPLLAGLYVFLFSIPSKLVKRLIIALATKKMKQYPNLVVVGITGSYGKSTVKEFASHILSAKHRVIRTPKNINTEIGVSLFILKHDFSKYDVFVVEMGAYVKGDIATICQIVKPTYGILTAINEQHLSLFGNIRATQQAKYELLRSLPKNGVAIVNSDNPYCREFLDTLESSVDTFGLHEEYNPTLLISDVSENRELGTMSCANTINGKVFAYTTTIPGSHNVKNIAACMLLAHYFGLTHDEVQMQIQTLSLPDKTLHIRTYGSAIIIDDSANSNPDGFKSALDTLSTYSSSRKRIVITRGMHELGTRSEILHEEVGGEIDFIADELVIISDNFADALESGMSEKYHTIIKRIYDQEELLAYVRSLKETNAVILIENRLPLHVYQEILKG